MQSKWIWYYGDFELYHSLKMQSKREEYDFVFPPFWRLDDCWHNVKFIKEVDLEEDEEIIVYACGKGNVELDGKRNPLGKPLYITSGKHLIMVNIINTTDLPCIYVRGKSIVSDESWAVSHYGGECEKAGYNDMYTDVNDDPQIFKFSYKEIAPVKAEKLNNGILYDFGKEIFAKLCFDAECDISIYYGESREEACDAEFSYLRDEISAGKNIELPCKAFRYIYIPDIAEEQYSFRAYYEYLPLEVRGSFKCSDELINKIWDTSVYTFHLNSREFFLDGIKRDRWVWSGDAYQSYLINRYLFFDKDICKRTILALRGKDSVETHINTILDYSFYWIMSIYDYYEMTADKEFVERVYPKMKSLMDFCLSRLDKNGLASKVGNDWIFIDWADMDKTGAVCAEQILLLRSLEVMSKCSDILGKDSSKYQEMSKNLKDKINTFYWNEEKGAFIDSFESGKNNVTRHANIFAMLFGYVDEKQRKSIVENVLYNDSVTQIKTPYFKFYELDALCETGSFETVTERIKSYWGSMIENGATSIWEEYNPELNMEEQYAMYGDKYGKSLCHAWGASPVYLLGKYYLGVKPTSCGYKTFEVNPNLGGLDWIEGTVPVNGGQVSVKVKDGMIEILSDCDGGVLVHNGDEYVIEKNNVLRVEF